MLLQRNGRCYTGQIAWKGRMSSTAPADEFGCRSACCSKWYPPQSLHEQSKKILDSQLILSSQISASIMASHYTLAFRMFLGCGTYFGDKILKDYDCLPTDLEHLVGHANGQRMCESSRILKNPQEFSYVAKAPFPRR